MINFFSSCGPRRLRPISLRPASADRGSPGHERRIGDPNGHGDRLARQILPMAYIENRLVHDADAHIMETPNWLRDYADPTLRDRIQPPGYVNELRQTGDNESQLGDIDAAFARIVERHRSPEYRAYEAAEIMNRKNFARRGARCGA